MGQRPVQDWCPRWRGMRPWMVTVPAGGRPGRSAALGGRTNPRCTRNAPWSVSNGVSTSTAGWFPDAAQAQQDLLSGPVAAGEDDFSPLSLRVEH